MYLFLQTNRQEEHHSVKLVDSADQVLVLFQHRAAHPLAGNLWIVIDAVLEQVEIGGTLKFEQIRDHVDRCTAAACQTHTIVW